MSYSIGNIIYGISPDMDTAKIIEEHDIQEFDGFTTYYSGKAPTSPMMIGSFIKSINECADVDLTSLLLELDENKLEHINEFKVVRRQLLDTLETIAEDYGIEESIVNEIIEWINNTEPSFKIVWSTS